MPDESISSNSSDEELFVVESILARKKRGNKVYYLLKWEGYDETSWEPAENVVDKEMLQEYDRNFLGDQEAASAAVVTASVAECDICEGKRGTLHKCQKCSLMRHEKCVDDTLVEESHDGDDAFRFICNVCRSSDYACCICHESTENSRDSLRCRLCLRIFHDSCASEFDRSDSCCYECSNYPSTIEEILSMRRENKEKNIHENEYLVKFETWSHRKCFWVPESWLNIIAKIRLRYFKKDPVELSEMDVILEDWCRVDKIMCEQASSKESTKYLVKWKGLAPDKATWEDESSAGQFFLFNTIEISQDELRKAEKRYRKSLKINRKFQKVKPAKIPFQKLEPEDVAVEGQLMQYQLEGVNWMLYNWHKERNCLLADEMGLGKTIQSISLIEHLRNTYNVFPILVVAPSTVCENWIQEMNKWAPKLHHVLFSGSKESRDRLIEYELFNEHLELTSSQKRMRLIKNHVVVTSFQILGRECSTLKSIPWQMIIVDEAHRLKGAKNLLSKQLEGFNPCFRLLLTGTPLQNNIAELFNILSFLDPETFADVEELSGRFEDLASEKEKITELHGLLRPRILRRTKKDVGLDESIPPKREIMVPVSMTGPQMAIYKSIIEKNYKALASLGQPGSKKVSLTNIWMELRKCVNHAYLCVDELVTNDEQKAMEQLLAMSGKLELLDMILTRLKEQGHRVLIFSQMTRMLDIIQDYLDLKGFQCGRLDGQTPVTERQGLIGEFNAPDSEIFCFLLSTRAGGLGINLTTADTVIIFDHDYNPHNDLQALCRAHRIGQKNVLHIYRLVTVNSIEESVVAIAKKKLVLDHVVVESMNGMNQSDIATILRMGVQSLFSGETPQKISYDDAALELLLDRNQAAGDPLEVSPESASASTENVSIFKEEVFSCARVWEQEEGQSQGRVADATFWSHFIPMRDPSPKKEYGKGHRRKQPTYLSEAALLGEAIIDVEDSSESEWEGRNSESSSSEGILEDNVSEEEKKAILAGAEPGKVSDFRPYVPKDPNKSAARKSTKKATGPYKDAPSSSTEASRRFIKKGPTSPPVINPNSEEGQSRAPLDAKLPERRQHISAAELYQMLGQIILVPTTMKALVGIIHSSPLLSPSQREGLLAAISFVNYDPIALPAPEMAYIPHNLYGLVSMAINGEPGLFSLMLVKANMSMYTFFIPSRELRGEGFGGWEDATRRKSIPELSMDSMKRLITTTAGTTSSIATSSSMSRPNSSMSAAPFSMSEVASPVSMKSPVPPSKPVARERIVGVSTIDDRVSILNVPKQTNAATRNRYTATVTSSVAVAPAPSSSTLTSSVTVAPAPAATMASSVSAPSAPTSTTKASLVASKLDVPAKASPSTKAKRSAPASNSTSTASLSLSISSGPLTSSLTPSECQSPPPPESSAWRPMPLESLKTVKRQKSVQSIELTDSPGKDVAEQERRIMSRISPKIDPAPIISEGPRIRGSPAVIVPKQFSPTEAPFAAAKAPMPLPGGGFMHTGLKTDSEPKNGIESPREVQKTVPDRHFELKSSVLPLSGGPASPAKPSVVKLSMPKSPKKVSPKRVALEVLINHTSPGRPKRLDSAPASPIKTISQKERASAISADFVEKRNDPNVSVADQTADKAVKSRKLERPKTSMAAETTPTVKNIEPFKRSVDTKSKRITEGIKSPKKSLNQLESELRQYRSKEALLLTQAAQLQRLAEENQRLKRENDMLRTIRSSNSFSASSEKAKPRATPQKINSPVPTEIAPAGKCFGCRWSGCSYTCDNINILRSHVRTEHLKRM